MKLRTFTISLLALAAALPLATPATAKTTDKQAETLSEFDASRNEVREAVSAYRQGESERAYRLAVSAYLQHFERVEPQLRVLDSDLTLELEDRYAALREAIKSGDGLSDVRADATTVYSGLDEFESKVRRPGVAAASVAAVSSFGIIFREGMEAMLVLVALLGFLRSAERRRYRRPVLAGTGAAVLASIGCFFVFGLLIDIAPLQRELIEAITTVVAVVVLFTVSFWLLQRIDHRHWMEFVRSRLWGAAARGSVLAVGLVGFVAVFREGFETVLFYQALLFYAGDVTGWVVVGFAAGLLALAGLGFALFKLHSRLPLKSLMTTAVAMVMLLSIAFVGNAVNQLQNLDYLPDTSLRDSFPRIPVQIADLTGIHPTVQSLAAQAGLAVIYLIGIGVLVAIHRRRQRDSLLGEPQGSLS